MEWSLITSLILNVAFLLIIIIQASKMNVLRRESVKSLPYEDNEELMTEAREKLKTVGDVKTVKFLREETGMSMLDAKRLVDTLKE